MGWDLLHHQALDLITSEVGGPLMSRSALPVLLSRTIAIMVALCCFCCSYKVLFSI